MQKDRWIIEGTYLSTSDERLSTADMIIFLDIHVIICLWHVIKRRIQYHNKNRHDLPIGCTEKLHLTYILKVLVFPLRGRRHLFQKRTNLLKVRNINFIQLSSLKQVELFLQNETKHQQPMINVYHHQSSEVQNETTHHQLIPELSHVGS